MNIRILIQNAVKSKAFLASIILMSISNMLNIVNLISNPISDNFTNNMVNSEIYYELGLDKFVSSISIISMLNSIPLIIILAGMCILYYHSVNGELLKYKTSGLTVIKTGTIMYIIQMGITVAAAIVLLSLMFGNTDIATYFMPILILTLLFVVTIMSFVVIYYISIIRFINTLKYSLITGKPSVKYLTLTGVLNYILLGISSFSFIALTLENIIQTLPLIFNTVALFLITTKMFQYKININNVKN